MAKDWDIQTSPEKWVYKAESWQHTTIAKTCSPFPLVNSLVKKTASHILQRYLLIMFFHFRDLPSFPCLFKPFSPCAVCIHIAYSCLSNIFMLSLVPLRPSSCFLWGRGGMAFKIPSSRVTAHCRMHWIDKLLCRKLCLVFFAILYVFNIISGKANCSRNYRWFLALPVP